MRIILLFFAIIFSSSSFCQIKISGKITDNKNKPLFGVSVSILNSYDGTSSDSTGYFSFTTSETGTHILTASYAGYRDFSQPFQIQKENYLIIAICSIPSSK